MHAGLHINKQEVFLYNLVGLSVVFSSLLTGHSGSALLLQQSVPLQQEALRFLPVSSLQLLHDLHVRLLHGGEAALTCDLQGRADVEGAAASLSLIIINSGRGHNIQNNPEFDHLNIISLTDINTSSHFT